MDDQELLQALALKAGCPKGEPLPDFFGSMDAVNRWLVPALQRRSMTLHSALYTGSPPQVSVRDMGDRHVTTLRDPSWPKACSLAVARALDILPK